ncbi:MAG: hypothetical protein NTU57_00645 [Candidatus Aenigmarchaeota archaeon]|nr:hypothetical protein [Candidatus Aenigmarchaeota archaeon]
MYTLSGVPVYEMSYSYDSTASNESYVTVRLGEFGQSCSSDCNTQKCMPYVDGVCPQTCSLGVDADCCTNASKYWLQTDFGFSCYDNFYNLWCNPEQPCSSTADDCCPNWCAAGSDYDCCTQKGMCWTNNGCYTCQNNTCTDSDGGKNYYVKGTTTGPGYGNTSKLITSTDYCDGNLLKERYCDENDKFNSEDYACSYGCLDGRCKTGPYVCVDYEGEKNYYKKGTITNQFNQNYTDSCTNNTLREWYCDQYGSGANEYYACPNGCKDGACNNFVNALKVITPNGNEQFTTEKIIKFSFLVNSYKSGLLKYWIKNFATGTIYNIGSVSAIPSAFGYVYNLDWNLPVLKGMGEVMPSDGKQYKAFVEWKSDDGSEILSDESDNYFTITNPQTCTDSDGGKNYYTKGTVTDGNGVSTDGCFVQGNKDPSAPPECFGSDGTGNGKCINEGFCENEKTNYAIVMCPNGCKDGACVGGDNVKEQVKCVFDGATEDNKCYSDAGFSCHGIGSCVADVYGSKGQQLTWKSSCGGYAYTVIDGQNEYANFYCKPSSYCGNGVCEIGETQQSCPQDCVKNCPIWIDMSFNKEVYYPGDYFEVTIKLYDYNKKLMPNHAFNLYYTNNGNEYPTSTMYTDSAGIYKSSSQIPKDFHDFGEFIFVASAAEEGCNYVYDKENIYINNLGSCGDSYCSKDEKELVCTTTCATCPVEPISATSSVASAAITGAITTAATNDVSTCGCNEYCYVKCARDCTPNCGNGVCDTIACLAEGCPVPENEKNCPSDCGTINYCGSQSQDYNCVCQEGFKKEKFEAPCSAVTETASSTAITTTNNTICTDSDGGKNYYVKGYSTGSDGLDGTWSKEDKCLKGTGVLDYVESCSGNDCYLHEAICIGNLATVEVGVKCPNGCKDGACNKTNEEAYFKFTDGHNTFIFKLTDSKKIQEARAILNGSQTNAIHVSGTIDKKSIEKSVDYNSPWNYYLIPATIHFFDNAVEVCDASIQYLEDHLNESCGSFLPNCVWCPWGSKLIEEVKINQTQTCTDTDGGINYDVRGDIVVVYSDGTESASWDQCNSVANISGYGVNTLLERYCGNDQIQTIFYNCPNGCKDGACIKADTCTYYRCIPSFTYLNLQTDKYYYDIGEQVTISTNYLDKEKMTLQELTVSVKDPYGNLQEIVMKPECNTAEECPLCKPGGYCPPCSSVTTCQFKGVYAGTKMVGLYSVQSEMAMNSAYFRVYDYSLLKKYLILSDIDGYVYKDSNLMQGSEDITVYLARYEKSGKTYDAMVGEFESRDILNKYLSEILKSNPPSEEKFGGQYIYVLKSGSQKVYFWTNGPFLIVISEEMYAQMSAAVKSVIEPSSTETSTSIAIAASETATSASGGGLFTGMITGMPVATESTESFKHCGADSVSSECACMEGETKEEFMPSCKQGSECEMVLHYRCVQREPTELINAYLDKYPSDIKATGTECETKNGYCIYFQDSCKDGFEDSALACKTKSEKCCVKEVNREDFIEISLKLESMRVKMDTFETKAEALAAYYMSVGDEQRAAKFQEVAGMLSMAKEKIDRIITKIKDNMDDLESVREEIKSDIKGLRSYIRNILVKMVS